MRHRNARAAEHRIATENFGIADNQTAGPAQFAQRGCKRATRFAQVDLDQASLERHDIPWNAGEGVEYLAP